MKSIYIITLIAITGLNTTANAQTITSVASGNWTSPITWGGYPPTPGTIVIINHAVTLDLDYAYSSGSITINASGALNGNSQMRALAIQGGTLTVNGTLNVARVALFAGTITNSGIFQNDSLYTTVSLTNNSGATINADQFMIDIGSTFNNNGTVVSTNFWNVSSVTNNGTITTSDFLNSKSFTNAATGLITSFDFLNADSLAGPAVFTNNGSVTVNHDWANTKTNTAQVNGSGKFCIQNNSYNSGDMSGTFDFCSLAGGTIGLNTGTIAGTITYCQYSCATGMSDYADNLSVSLYPNPSTGVFTVDLNSNEKTTILIYNGMGKLVYSKETAMISNSIDLSSLAQGIYSLKVISEKNNGVKHIMITK